LSLLALPAVAAPVSVAELSRADVVVVGEQHRRPQSHAAELSLVQQLYALRPHLVLSLEMFERDTQVFLDAYLAGNMDESTFLVHARPWPNYASDYRPLVEFAKAHHLPVLAANVPQPIAALVAHAGLASLATLPPHEQAWCARHVTVGDDAYRQAFAAAMGGNPHGGDIGHFFEAQCLRDDTMAETIADALERAGPTPPLIVHVTGAFHMQNDLGTVQRLRWRLPWRLLRSIDLSE
jgi:uncharacterized iron-regulated protein